MARRKNPITEIDEVLVESVVETTCATDPKIEPISEEEGVEGTDSIEKSKEGEADKTEKSPKTDIPENILATLKIFSNYPELLITPHGCVYTPGCKLDAAEAAILYKNPFYNT